MKSLCITLRKGRSITKKLNSYISSGDLKNLSDGSTLKSSFYFSPIGMRDIEDEEIKVFWETEILSQLTNIVKAA